MNIFGDTIRAELVLWRAMSAAFALRRDFSVRQYGFYRAFCIYRRTLNLQGTARLKMIISSFSALSSMGALPGFFVCFENKEILSV